MTNEKSSLKNQRDAYFQALENDEKILKKNKRKHGNTNTKSEQMERKKQLDSKRKLALEKLQKKNKSIIIMKHSQQQEVTEDEKEDQTITGIPGPPTDEKPLTREELRKFRFFRVAFPLGVKAGETIRAQIPFGPIVKVTVPHGLEEETEKEEEELTSRIGQAKTTPRASSYRRGFHHIGNGENGVATPPRSWAV